LKRPFFTRLGGKSRLRKTILRALPSECGLYCEPFVGAGWVFMAYEGAVKYVISDMDSQVTDMWNVLRSVPIERFKAAVFDFKRSDRFYRNKANTNQGNGRAEKNYSICIAIYSIMEF